MKDTACSRRKSTVIRIITILLLCFLAMMLFGCSSNTDDTQPASEESSSSADEKQVVWNGLFKSRFHTDTKMETQFADMLHNVDQTDGAVTLCQTLNNGKVMYIAFEIDSMANDISDAYKGEDLSLLDCILIRGYHSSEDLKELSKIEITDQYKEQLIHGNVSFQGSAENKEKGKTGSLWGFFFSLASDSTFTGDITVVLPDLNYVREGSPLGRVVSDNYVFHITETSTRLPVEQTIIYHDQTVGKFRLTELNLQLCILKPDEAEELASALILNPDEFTNPRIKLLDKNREEINCRLLPSGMSNGGVVTADFILDRIIDTGEVSGIQVGDYIIDLKK